MNRSHRAKVPHHAVMDVGYRLRDDTDSADDVARMVSVLLNVVETFDHKATQADILQALAVTTAVRKSLVTAAQRSGVNITMRLLGMELGEEGEVPSAGQRREDTQSEESKSSVAVLAY